MRPKGGFPTIYPVFVANLLRNKITDVVTPLPVPSAYHILKELGAKADMIHIGAGHEYDDVKADIRMYMEILEEDGVITGMIALSGHSRM